MKKKIEKINNHAKKLIRKKELLQQFSALITAGFGLVAALAWNSLIQNIFRQFFGEQNTIPSQLVYAVIVTVIAVYMAYIMGKAISKLV